MQKMSLEEARGVVLKLREEIETHNHLYYQLQTPQISDLQYDSKMRILRDLEEKYPHLIVPTSPTQRVSGRPMDQFSKVQHRFPMLSIDNVFSQQELYRWDERNRKALGIVDDVIDYICEPKFDGLAIDLTYVKNTLLKAATRGDGFIGEDVTHTVSTIQNIPTFIDNLPASNMLLNVRGEVVMMKENFLQLNKRCAELGVAPFSNPRNAAAGTVRQHDPETALQRGLHFLAYDIRSNTKGQFEDSQLNSLIALSEYGFTTGMSTGMRCQGIYAVQRFFERFEKIRKELPFECDGLVVKVNRKFSYEKLGFTAKYPKGAIAYKFSPTYEKSKVTDIEISIAATGTLTPVANIEPVMVTGVMVRRINLYNFDVIHRMDLRVGDSVMVYRAGDVNPKIHEILPRASHLDLPPYVTPTHCPVCGTAVIREGDKVALKCPNPVHQNKE